MKLRIIQGFTRRAERERHGARDVLAVFRIKLGLPIKADDLRRDLDRRIRDIKALYQADAALSLLQRTPKGRAPDANRRHAADACDADAARLFKTSEHVESVPAN